MDQLFNLEFQFESAFNLEFRPKFSIQLGIPIPMGINLGECSHMFLVVLNVGLLYRTSFREKKIEDKVHALQILWSYLTIKHTH